MSFGGGGGTQGSIRYALIVDDAQATQKLNTFKTSLSSLGTPTANLNKNLAQVGTTLKGNSASIMQSTTQINQLKTAQTGFNTATLTTGKNVATMGNNFKATVTQIKSAGPPLGQLEKTTASLGSKIKDNASKFSGLATGLSATASGALQLAAGFRDYNDAQIAVDRVTRRLSLGQEALGKAQSKLNALQKSGKASSAELAQAQLDVTQAQKQVEIQTQLVGEAQERMFDSQTQFVASVVPTVLGAVGSLGAAFKAFGGEGGALSKVKDSLANMRAGMSAATKEMVLMGGAATAGVAVALLIIDTIEKARAKWKQLGVEFTESSIFDTKKMSLSAAEWDEIVKRTGASTSDWVFNQEALLKKFREMGGLLDKNKNIVITFTDRNIKLGDAFKKNGETAATWIHWMEVYRENGETNEQVMARLTKAGFDNATATKIAAAAEEDYNNKRKLGIPTIQETTVATEKHTEAVKGLNTVMGEGVQFWFPQYILNMKKWRDEIQEAGRVAPTTFKIDPGTTAYFQFLNNGFAGVRDSVTTTIREFGTSLPHLNDVIEANLPQPLVKLLEGITDPTQRQKIITEYMKFFGDLGVKGKTAAEKAAEETTKAWTDAMTDVINASGGSTEVIVENQKRAAQAADEAAKQAAKAWQDFATEFNNADLSLASALGLDKKGKAEDVFKDMVKDLPKKLEKELKGNLKANFKIEESKEGVKMFIESIMDAVASNKSQFIFDPNLHVDKKKAQKYGKEILEEIKNIPDSDTKAAGKDLAEAISKGDMGDIRQAITDVLKTLDPAPIPVYIVPPPAEDISKDIGTVTVDGAADITKVDISSLKPVSSGARRDVQAGFHGGSGGGGGKSYVNIPATAHITNIVYDPGKPEHITRPPEILAEKEKREQGEETTPETMVLKVNNMAAIKAIDVVAKRIDSLSRIIPILHLNSKTAIKLIDVVAKRWDSLASIIPVMHLNTKTAIKLVDVVAKRWDSLSKLNPQMHINTKKAISAIDVAARRIQSLGDINPTVTVKVNYTGIKKFQHGFHGWVDSPMPFIAGEAGSEYVSVTPKSKMGRGTTSSGGGGGGGASGQIVINLTNVNFDRETTRTFRREMGKELYRFGPT